MPETIRIGPLELRSPSVAAMWLSNREAAQIGRPAP